MRAFLLSSLPALLLLAVLAPPALAEAGAESEASPPRNLEISHIGDGILVTWDPPAMGTVDAYVIERVTSLGLAPPVTVNAATTQFIDEVEITGNLAAAYRVTAMFSDGSEASSAAGAAFLEWVPTGPFCSVMIGTETSLDGHCWIDFVVDEIPEDCPERETIRFTLHGIWADVEGLMAFIKTLVPSPPMPEAHP